jgi:hypothetical protein
MDAAILTEALASPELLQSIIGHFPSELIEAELALLPKAQQLRFLELSKRLNQLQIGDTVYYTNSDQIERCRAFEGLELKIDRILRGGGDGTGDLAVCTLPDGSQQTFGLRTLRATNVNDQVKK